MVMPQLTEVADAAVSSSPAVLHEFEALDQCHRDVLAALRQLVTLVDHLDDQGVDTIARSLATEVGQFFSQAARAHHADEERLIFPTLLQSNDPELVQHVKRLQQDHGWLEEDWLVLSAQLDSVAQGYSWHDIDMLRHASTVFVELYMDHIDLEESLIYPEARRRMANSGAAREARAHR